MNRQLLRSFAGVCLLASGLLAADVDGIWAGQQPGRRGEPEDVAFRFKVNGQTLTGKLFGDEFDLPISEATVSGDQIRFTITTINYYNGGKTVFVYTGSVRAGAMELVRERVQTAEDIAAKRPVAKQTLKLKRVD